MIQTTEWMSLGSAPVTIKALSKHHTAPYLQTPKMHPSHEMQVSNSVGVSSAGDNTGNCISSANVADIQGVHIFLLLEAKLTAYNKKPPTSCKLCKTTKKTLHFQPQFNRRWTFLTNMFLSCHGRELLQRSCTNIYTKANLRQHSVVPPLYENTFSVTNKPTLLHFLWTYNTIVSIVMATMEKGNWIHLLSVEPLIRIPVETLALT